MADRSQELRWFTLSGRHERNWEPERNTGGEARQGKPEASRAGAAAASLWVLIALLFNVSQEYVGAESTTSPSCYFVTTLQNT